MNIGFKYGANLQSSTTTLLTNTADKFLYWYQLDTQFLYKLHKIKFLYMFRASSAQSLPLASVQDGHLQRMRIPEAAYMYN